MIKEFKSGLNGTSGAVQKEDWKVCKLPHAGKRSFTEKEKEAQNVELSMSRVESIPRKEIN